MCLNKTVVITGGIVLSQIYVITAYCYEMCHNTQYKDVTDSSTEIVLNQARGEDTSLVYCILNR